MPDAKQMEAVVHAYVRAFADGDPAAAAALFAPEATIEDPVGSPPLKGQDAVLAFYTAIMGPDAQIELTGPVRAGGDHAAFAFSIHLRSDEEVRRVDVIDTFRFDQHGKIMEMRAFVGPANMHGFEQ